MQDSRQNAGISKVTDAMPTYRLEWATEVLLPEEEHLPPKMNETTLLVNRIVGRNVHSLTLEEIRGDCAKIGVWVSTNGLRAGYVTTCVINGKCSPFGNGFLRALEFNNHGDPPSITVEFRDKPLVLIGV